VRRFRNPDGGLRDWECAASLQLRDRDLAAIAEYERRGRLHAGPAERMHDTAYRAWLTDHLNFAAAGAGDVALLMADTEAGAADLSTRARADLVRRGLVQPAGTGLADGTVAGVGDLIVTRLNERRIRVDAGEGFIANRDTWRVVERDNDGSLTVQAVTGTTRRLTLPRDYVAANVQLAYAGTVHSAQGRTVATARGIVTDATTAEALYVMLTRGQTSNDIYITTDVEDAEPHQNAPTTHAVSVLASILERDDAPTRSVTDTERDLYDQATSLHRLRHIFGDLSAAIAGSTYARIITETGGESAADRARTDPAWPSLVHLLTNAAATGWDAPELLRTAIRQRELGTAADVAAVLHWRVTGILAGANLATPTPTVGADLWQERAAAITADVSATNPAAPVVVDAADALTQAAGLMDRRVIALAERLAEQATTPDPPTWLTTLGPVPDSGRRRTDWLTRARAIAAYQDATAYQPVGEDPIGPRPPAGDIDARQLWELARTALAEVSIAVSMRAMLPDRLRDYVQAGINAETHGQPPYIGHELRQLSLRARAQRTRVNRLRQENQKAAGQLATADRRRFRRDAVAIDSLTRSHDATVARLTKAETTLRQIDTELGEATAMREHWQHWETRTTEIRAAARLATQELSLRGLPPVDEQLPLPDTSNAQPAIDPEPLYAVVADAARYYQQHLDQRWAGTYLASRKLDLIGRAAGAGYAPSRPGQWTLLLDHLRAAGHADAAITAAGLAVPSRRGQLIDRFRDRVVLPIHDEHDRPIGFMGRKPQADHNPDNPKYLNPATTPIYDKSAALYGLNQAAIERLHAGAAAIVVEGPTDVLAIRTTGTDLVPVATCGTALTDQHLQLLAEHTDLEKIVWAFDGDTAGQNAAKAAGRRLENHGVEPVDAQIMIVDEKQDPADILAAHGPDQLRELVEDHERRGQILDLFIDDHLNQWDTYDHDLSELPIRYHAAMEATTLLLDLSRAEDITRHITRIANRTGVDAAEITSYLLERRFPDPDLQDGAGAADTTNHRAEPVAEQDSLHEPEPSP
jgi:DNA primase catalytic core